MVSSNAMTATPTMATDATVHALAKCVATVAVTSPTIAAIAHLTAVHVL
jgi:hypothetical protein